MIRRKSLVLVVEDDPVMLRFIRLTLEVNDLAVLTLMRGVQWGEIAVLATQSKRAVRGVAGRLADLRLNIGG